MCRRASAIKPGKPLPFQPEPSDMIRFLSKLELAEPPEGVGVEGKCWLWTGHCDDQGYGQIKVKGRAVWTHRYAREALRGPITEGMQLDHLCTVRNCCNPAHTEEATHGKNASRTRRNGRTPATAPF